MKNKRLVFPASIAMLFAAGIIPLIACDIPVYRYALMRWEPDAYNLTIFHSGVITSEVASAIAALKSVTERAPANLEITTAEVDSDATAPDVPTGTPAVKIPGAVLGYPPRTQPGQAAWEGAVSVVLFNHLADSPARRELAKRLLEGKKPAWIMIESGNKSADANAARELAALQLDAVRISRTDPAEQIFISILLHTEDGLEKYTSQPLVFPVFGRGRVLYALAGKGINADNLSAVIQFLTGPCACEIKAENPGTDLLMAVDWDGALGELAITDEEQLALATIPTETEDGSDTSSAQVSASANSAVPPANIATGLALAAATASETTASPETAWPGIMTIAISALIFIALVVLAISALVIFSRRR